MTDRPIMMLTGGSRGIGHAIARDAQARGWHVCLGLRGDRPQLPAGLDPDHAEFHPYDATDRGSAAPWVADVVARHGRIDAVVASAGIITDTLLTEASDDEVDNLFEINVHAPRKLASAAWKALCETGHGRVVILGSLSGKRVAGKATGLYAVSKFAAVALAHALRHEGWEQGVRATAVCPGPVATDMGASAAPGSRELSHMTQPEDVAGLVMHAIELPNTASVPELHVNCRLDGLF
ncbi:SDR family NAD(P)-dependent oxidoreductase [uncultured Martelella sp.]|uniref:SDR family NAD(P)-dependent oxidoreductase n=1 Tax=uncultured Martelella sp. TaxID=392331 RepID=UPI0029C743CC|nr:SDR family NAD(P)-dependent oxidoreductase [uncultured Martelella sp.]